MGAEPLGLLSPATTQSAGNQSYVNKLEERPAHRVRCLYLFDTNTHAGGVCYLADVTRVRCHDHITTP
jgi:hypothetical protein